MEVNNRILKSFLIMVVLLVWLNVFRIGYINLRPFSSRQITTPAPKTVTTLELKDTSIKRRPGFAYPAKGLIDPFRKDRGIKKKKKRPSLKKKETKVTKKVEKIEKIEETLPLAKPLPTESSLFLTTIIWDRVSPVAVLQERGSEKTYIVRVGDLVAAERVEDITMRSVTVSSRGKKFKLRLGRGGEKKEALPKKAVSERKPTSKRGRGLERMMGPGGMMGLERKPPYR